jgi:glycosyltransferase involved in cell wall biosynthesis
LVFEAVLAGEGSMKKALQDKVKRSEISGRVQFVGRIAQVDLPRFYNSADVYISASHVDGSSLSLMEAMACGTVPLVSDIPSNREWVENGVSGWLFEDGDSRHLAERLLEVDKQRHQMTTISNTALSIAGQRADWQINSRFMLDGYDLAMKLHDEQGL